MKEVSRQTQNLCGATQYFGDIYSGGECVLKKCAAECVEETYSFEFQGQVYSRQRYCCNDKDYCNSSFSKYSFMGPWVLGMATVFIWLYNQI